MRLLIFSVCILTVSLQAAPIVIDRSDENVKAIAKYDAEVRCRINFSALRETINKYIVEKKSVSIGTGSDKCVVYLKPLPSESDWHLIDQYQKVYVSDQWRWEESDNKIFVWFFDYTVLLTLEFQVTDKGAFVLIDEHIADGRNICP